jgi:hypothetical protein
MILFRLASGNRLVDDGKNSTSDEDEDDKTYAYSAST